MPKKQTVRFYTVSDRYVDWKYLSDVTYFEILNWLRSGNHLRIGQERMNNNASANAIFALLRRAK
jgi:hypothetical protein